MTNSNTLFIFPSFGHEPRNDQEIRDLILELRDAQTKLEAAPVILDIVNDLAISCEDLFSQGMRTTDKSLGNETISHLAEIHVDFLKTYAAFAEDVRATNGEIREEFFTFLDSGPLRGLRLAA